MTWQSKRMLKETYSDRTFLQQFAQLDALKELFSRATRVPDYEPRPEAAKAIVLTSLGEATRQAIISRRKLSADASRFAIFLILYHHELLVDTKETDIDVLAASLNSDLLQNRLQFPWLFDHLLYDRAFELFLSSPDELDRAQTLELLEGTPTGVFHAERYVVGPFGVLTSFQRRTFYPRSKLLLWHCADATCNHAHTAYISQPNEILQDAIDLGRILLEDEYGQPSEWSEFGADMSSDYDWYDDYSTTKMPWLLGNAFSLEELRRISAHLISSGGGPFRNKLPKQKQFKSVLLGSASDISGRLTKPQALQLVMLASDQDIIGTIDDLVETKQILIPPCEVRTPVASAPVENWSGVACECSALGLRVVAGDKTTPLARLRRLILALYKSDVQRSQLGWLLGRGRVMGQLSDDALGEHLERYILSHHPKDVLRELVFLTPEKLNTALEYIRAAHLKLPDTEAQDERLIQRMLWKIGFPPTVFESQLESLYQLLEQFRFAAQLATPLPDQWKKGVISSGATFFNVLEEILDATLAFSSWILLSDHFTERHVYNLKRARQLMASELKGVIKTQQGPLELDPTGVNTLAPLVLGFIALSQHAHELLKTPQLHAKPKVLLAHYSHQTTLQIFPYRHDRFVFDAPEPERNSCLEALRTSGEMLRDGNVAVVRNAVIHPRQKFPTKPEILQACHIVEEIVRKLEKAGLIPVVYATVAVDVDSYGREKVVSADYSNCRREWTPSPALKSIKSLPRLTEPQILVQCLHLAGTNELLRFGVEEGSDYTEMWKDYPKRRQPTPEDTRAAAEAVL